MDENNNTPDSAGDVNEVKEENKKSGESKEKKSKSKKNEKEGFGAKIAAIRGEFAKIIWLKPNELAKQTVTVILVSLMVGVIIFLMDTVFKFGYVNVFQLITDLITPAVKG